MAGVEINPEVARALEEIHQYLSDQLLPLMVADAIHVLLAQPPQLTASCIHSWVSSLSRRDPSIPLSDFLYHAVTKLYQMQEYKLVSPQEFAPFLAALKQAVLTYCPPEDQGFLKQNLDLIGQSQATNLSSQAGVVIRPGAAAEKAPAAQPEPEKEKEARRFGYLLNRLGKRLAQVLPGPEKTSPAAGPLPPRGVPAQEDVVNEALADAARSTNEATELKRVLDHLRQLGIQASPDDLFRALGRTLPGWSLPSKPDVQLPESSNLQAMHRIISKAPDSQEAANHFRHLIKAAVERFNEGFLPQASSMFDLAHRIITAKEVDPKVVELVLTKGHENLDEEKLRKFAENPAFADCSLIGWNPA